MSSEPIPLSTNEEVVEEVTKGLEADLRVTEEDPSRLPQSTPSNSNKEDPGIPEGFEDSDDESSKDDLIDEDQLKNLETTLSEEEKVSRRKEAATLKELGNKDFKEQKYLESIESYTKALRLCPPSYANDRSIFYGNRAASKMKCDRTKSAIDDCTKALELNDRYVKVYERRAKLYEDTEKLDESLADYKKILEIDPHHGVALQAQYKLQISINERNEKLKTEMFGKLKDLGNLILKPFGMSTDNFQLQQNPDGGGYSVNFTQNPK